MSHRSNRGNHYLYGGQLWLRVILSIGYRHTYMAFSAGLWADCGPAKLSHPQGGDSRLAEPEVVFVLIPANWLRTRKNTRIRVWRH